MSVIFEDGSTWEHADGGLYRLMSTAGAYKQDDGQWRNGLIVYQSIEGGPICMTTAERWVDRFAISEDPEPRRICENCRHWNNSVTPADTDNAGRCQAMPPVAMFGVPMGVFPFTEDVDLCGAFQHLQKGI